MSEEELKELEKWYACAWYYPANKPEGNRDAKVDMATLINEVRRLKRALGE
jgi:hypothetical protein